MSKPAWNGVQQIFITVLSIDHTQGDEARFHSTGLWPLLARAGFHEVVMQNIVLWFINIAA